MAHVVILGGGFGGLAAANEARTLLDDEHRVTVVSADDSFYMGFAKLWDLGGVRPLADGTRSLSGLARRGIEFVHGQITAIDPSSRMVTTTSGELEADVLVVALGAGPSPAQAEMLAANPRAFDLYDGLQLEAMKTAIAGLQEGTVVVGILGGPFKCPPAPYEAAMLIDERLRSLDRRDQVELVMVTPQPITLPAAGPDASRYVASFLEERNIRLRSGAPITSVSGGDAKADRTVAIDGSESVQYDLFFGVPATSPPPVLATSGLAGPSGFIHPDRHTLLTEFDDVYAIGDCTAIKTANGQLPKAGVFAAGQGEVVARRIAAGLSGQEPPTFDGHGYCFLEVPGNKVAFVEGDFYADPPDVSLSEADEAQFRRKQAYETERLDAWLG
ncbi:MAG: NAD(P)/FAD-dependent oxidoreductase [Acidimicrobiales bacterium]